MNALYEDIEIEVAQDGNFNPSDEEISNVSEHAGEQSEEDDLELQVNDPDQLEIGDTEAEQCRVLPASAQAINYFNQMRAELDVEGTRIPFSTDAFENQDHKFQPRRPPGLYVFDDNDLPGTMHELLQEILFRSG